MSVLLANVRARSCFGLDRGRTEGRSIGILPPAIWKVQVICGEINPRRLRARVG